MLFVQPQRGTAPCRLLTAGLTELLLAAQEGEKKHDGMTGRQPRQDPQNSFAAQVGELNSFPLNLKIGLGSWNVSHLLLSASAAEKKPDEEVGERPTNDTGEPGPTPFLRLCKTTFVTPASPSPFEQGESRCASRAETGCPGHPREPHYYNHYYLLGQEEASPL